MILGPSENVHKTNSSWLWLCRNTSKNTREPPDFFSQILLLQVSESQKTSILEKCVPTHPWDLFLFSLKILNMASTFRKKHEIEILKLSIQLKELKQLKVIYVVNQGIPPIPHHSDSHPCISPPQSQRSQASFPCPTSSRFLRIPVSKPKIPSSRSQAGSGV